jgi:hypothetical protein
MPGARCARSLGSNKSEISSIQKKVASVGHFLPGRVGSVVLAAPVREFAEK